jgi:hypothetical protein
MSQQNPYNAHLEGSFRTINGHLQLAAVRRYGTLLDKKSYSYSYVVTIYVFFL